MNEQWRRESAEVMAADWTLRPCRVCGAPVRHEDEPVPVYDSQDGPKSGVIHGTFDCMDAERCDGTMSGTSSSGEWSAQCILPETHRGDCLAGVP